MKIGLSAKIDRPCNFQCVSSRASARYMPYAYKWSKIWSITVLVAVLNSLVKVNRYSYVSSIIFSTRNNLYDSLFSAPTFISKNFGSMGNKFFP